MGDTGKLAKKLSKMKKNLSEWGKEISECFKRNVTAEVALSYIQALMSQVERKNGWQLAEEMQMSTPDKVNKLLNSSDWDVDHALTQHQHRVGKCLGFADGNLAFDETGFLKKGEKSAGVGRQYTGTAGKIENCQIGVFACWKTRNGQTLLDRELYLPSAWIDDRARCEKAHIPQERAFMTKIELAGVMYKRIIGFGYCPDYVTADEVYGRDSKFRNLLESYQQPYVVAVSSDQAINFGVSKTKMSEYATRFKERNWKRRSVGDGSKGPRIYDWALEEIQELENGFKRILLFRRSVSDPTEVAYYFGYAKKKATFNQIIRAAGSRWSIEECFESSKGEVGLDQYEVRTWTGWYRHITLAMIAHSFLVITKSEIFPSETVERTPFEDFKKKRQLLYA